MATDTLLFSRIGVPLVHRYHARSGTHGAFRGTYMARLRTFLNLMSRDKRRRRSLASPMSPEVPGAESQSEDDPFVPAQYISLLVCVGCCGYFGVFDTCCGSSAPVWLPVRLFPVGSLITSFRCSGIADGDWSNAVGA